MNGKRKTSCLVNLFIFYFLSLKRDSCRASVQLNLESISSTLHTPPVSAWTWIKTSPNETSAALITESQEEERGFGGWLMQMQRPPALEPSAQHTGAGLSRVHEDAQWLASSILNNNSSGLSLANIWATRGAGAEPMPSAGRNETKTEQGCSVADESTVEMTENLFPGGQKRWYDMTVEEKWISPQIIRLSLKVKRKVLSHNGRRFAGNLGL